MKKFSFGGVAGPLAVRTLFPLGCFCLIQAALAQGYWTVAYSGGQQSLHNGGTYPYTLNNGGYGGGMQSDSGPITATFTWHGAFPPSSVYVQEACNASGFSMPGQPAPAADNGLSSGATTTQTELGQSGLYETTVTSSGTEIQLASVDGNTCTVTCDASASGGTS